MMDDGRRCDEETVGTVGTGMLTLLGVYALFSASQLCSLHYSLLCSCVCFPCIVGLLYEWPSFHGSLFLFLFFSSRSDPVLPSPLVPLSTAFPEDLPH